MTRGDVESPAEMLSRRLQFDRYVLDLDRGCLLRAGEEITLRPKTFAVLHFLIENAGRLVSKDQIFAAVWPNIAVTDDALVQSIGELRRALGDDGARLIKTFARRGYRFESEVSVLPGQPSTGPVAGSSASTSYPLAPHTVAPKFLGDWVKASSRSRIGLLTSFALITVLATGAVLYGVWNPNVVKLSDRSTAKSPEVGVKPALAILPFANQSDDPAREYFTDGLTQDIINALGKFSALTVMSWNAVFPYKGKPASPDEIGRRLGVRYHVEGSVQRTGERLRVIAQLVDIDGRVLWSARFDEALADLFVLQDRITREIAGALAIRVTQAEQRLVLAKPTKSLEAYDYVLRARPALQRPARANVVEARALLRRAIEVDPSYAAAYAALAETFFVSVSMGWAESPTEFLGHAEEMANKALSLDDTDVRARIVLGRIHIFYHRYAEAKAEIDRAIAINPNDANGLAGHGNILMWSGQADAAIQALELAQRIDPELNPLDRFALSLAYYLKGQYAAAAEQAQLNLRKTEGANFSRIVLAAAYAQQTRTEDTARLVATIRAIDPTFDPQEFGTKFLNAVDLDHLRDGLRKAGFSADEAGRSP
jgi:adenylate cyclase